MNQPPDVAPATPQEVIAHYSEGREQRRLSSGVGLLERARMEALLAGSLPRPPTSILDVGGGPGHYACWLAQHGYEVHLIDPVPLHIAQATSASRAQPDGQLASIHLGDARDLWMGDASVDVVLLFGPLYHLPQHEDRAQALREARRVLRPTGTLMAIGVSRFAALIDGLRRCELFSQPGLAEFVWRFLPDGRDLDYVWRPGDFPSPYLHLPRDLSDEVTRAGFVVERIAAVESLADALPDEAVEAFAADPSDWARLLELLEAIEADGSILGATGHIFVLARRDEDG